jgi:hypothetical protein
MDLPKVCWGRGNCDARWDARPQEEEPCPDLMVRYAPAEVNQLLAAARY